MPLLRRLDRRGDGGGDRCLAQDGEAGLGGGAGVAAPRDDGRSVRAEGGPASGDRLGELFECVLELEPGEQAAFLEAANRSRPDSGSPAVRDHRAARRRWDGFGLQGPRPGSRGPERCS